MSQFPPRTLAVDRALFALGYKNLRVHLVGHSIVGFLIAVPAWGVAPLPVMRLWMVWMVFTAIALLIGLIVFRKVSVRGLETVAQLKAWRLAHLFLLCCIGVAWGLAAQLMEPGQIIHNLMILNAFGGTLAYSSVSNGSHDPIGFGVSAVVALLMLMSRIPAIFGAQAWAVLAMCLLYFSVLVLAAYNSRQVLLELIHTKIENEELARSNSVSRAQAEQANRDKSDFLAAASHDLRQPVHALQLLIEAFRHQVPSSASHPLMIHIVAAGQAINALFSALMDLSKIESGREKVSITDFDFKALLTGLVDRHQAEASRKGLKLALFISEKLSWTTLSSDRFLVERLAGNLLSNAIRYTDHGGVLVVLRNAHCGASRDTGLWLEFWDTGVGIAPQNLERIFNPYVQLQNLERDRAKGLGLGLSIVKHSASLLSLSMQLRSRLGRGTCFRVFVPSALGRRAPVPLPPSVSGEALAGAHDLAGRRVLLIDDDPMVVLAMKAIFAAWRVDLRCAVVTDYPLLDRLDPDWTPECVLSDFRLPGPLDGIDLLDRLLERFPEAIGILQTGELALDFQVKAEDAGYLVMYKPVMPQVLASVLSVALRGRAKAARDASAVLAKP
jgi:two-component system, sensor histidine kinase